jgi:hypothetical protein
MMRHKKVVNMNPSATPSGNNPASLSEAKAGKNQFKCFVCRGIHPNKDGNWHDWEQMQVHLCRACDKSTQGNQARGHTK